MPGLPVITAREPNIIPRQQLVIMTPV